MIPDESDQINRPERPDLKCREHGDLSGCVGDLWEYARDLCTIVNNLQCRVTELEGTDAEARD